MGSPLLPDHPKLDLDSLHEQADAPVPGLTHRYPDKALFLALDTCPVYCRFCTRSYAVGVDTEEVEKVQPQGHRASAGSARSSTSPRVPSSRTSSSPAATPTSCAPRRSSEIGDALLAMPNVRRMRFATKGPAVMPQKILTDDAWIGRADARRREGPQAPQGGRAAHALQPPERDHRHHRARDEQAHASAASSCATRACCSAA